MKRVVLLAFAMNVALACATRAQELPPVSPPTPPTSPPATAPPPQTPPPAVPESKPTVPAAAQPVPALPAPLSDDLIRRRRDRLSIMEGVLTGAVRGAAQQIARRMATQDAGPFVLSGALTARGFILEGYGVFFHVEIPGVNYGVVPIEAMVRQRSAQQREAAPERAAAGTTPSPMPGDSDAEYVEVVKRALIEAMVENSKSLELQPQEWLTVAAADGQEPLMPTPYLVERATLVLRVRGADISDYMAGRMTLAEVSKKVEVRKF